MLPGTALTKDELYEADFPWTVIDGHVYAVGDYISIHPGGRLICRAIGEDASELFHTHHTSARALATLKRFEIGHFADGEGRRERPFQQLLNARIGSLVLAPVRPIAEAVAACMLLLFSVWVYLAYILGWWLLNVVLAWFWWRHLDAGLHSAVHGDFRYSAACQRFFLRVYGILSHHTLDYYHGDGALLGMGMSKHFWHHIHTNNPLQDPDWVSMNSEAWVRRHRSAPWRPYHEHQCMYWIAVTATFEQILELLNMGKSCIDAVAALLEPPSVNAPYRRRFSDACALLTEVLVGPGYQGAAFLCQPWWRALAVLLLARAVARVVLYPFSEVQHYMPENMPEHLHKQEEWTVVQLRTTANLQLRNPLARALDFLMFHGDSCQIEHHLWPAMSFVNLGKASKIVREACIEKGLPYHEVGYWEGYAKIREQVRQHARKPSTSGSRKRPRDSSSDDASEGSEGSTGARVRARTSRTSSPLMD